MAKQSDIVGTITIPEAGYGRFWNFMKTMPGAEFTPRLDAMSPTGDAVGPVKGKRTHGNLAEGSTGKCILLNALTKTENLTTKGATAVFVSAGKSPKSVGNVLFELKKAGMIGQDREGAYSIKTKGRAFISENCKPKSKLIKE